jgi:hypothetical protein
MTELGELEPRELRRDWAPRLASVG